MRYERKSLIGCVNSQKMFRLKGCFLCETNYLKLGETVDLILKIILIRPYFLLINKVYAIQCRYIFE